ncbi:MAG TPA: glutamine synthetase [Thermotogota bacterium]|nr:glutamine synthetase [Thermotogota bacterium]
MIGEELLYTVEAVDMDPDSLSEVLLAHPNIRFVSLVGVDLAGHDTDEKIPIRHFLEKVNLVFEAEPLLQTDGSSISLHAARLEDAKIDMLADLEAKWFVDYNWENIDFSTGLPVGTLRIPAYLKHHDRYICARWMLQKALSFFEIELRTLLGASGMPLESIEVTLGTELEFWVKTPAQEADVEELQVAQIMQENYWQRTKGNVRTALEESLELLERYGLSPEMGHKEVGGVKASIGKDGALSYVMEQIEIDWRYASGMQAVDNELFARIAVKEVFRRHGLEVSFQAKPIPDVAGNGKHLHLGLQGVDSSGEVHNLFSPVDKEQDFLSPLGYGAAMGILKNYHFLNPFIASSHDALNRLQPGFEAPVCAVCSLGKQPNAPSRNRTVLLCLISDSENEMARRFELRSPSPHTNLYAAVSAILNAMLQGMEHVLSSGKEPAQLLEELSSSEGGENRFLPVERLFRSESNLFEDFSAEERERLFGKAPRTVWENVRTLQTQQAEEFFTCRGLVDFSQVKSFARLALQRWVVELSQRRIPEMVSVLARLLPLEGQAEENQLDRKRWEAIREEKKALAKDDETSPSLFSQVQEAISQQDYQKVSELEVGVSRRFRELLAKYNRYRKNFL